MTPRPFSNNRAEILFLAEHHTLGKEALACAKQRTKEVQTVFSDSVSRLSGCGHDFVCSHCASNLFFDLWRPWDPEAPFVCPHCGAAEKGEKFTEAWVFRYRQTCADALEAVAVCALLGDADALSFLIRYVDFYADRYEAFPMHGKNAGKGKVMGQSLDEAIWACSLLRPILACEALLPPEKKETWAERLFVPLAALLLPQANAVHNIPFWIVSCVGMIGIVFENRELLDAALDGPFGIRRQVKEGFTAEGLWREGSLSYHYLSLRALTYFCCMYAQTVPDDPLIGLFGKMFATPLHLSWNGYSLPALNDDWYPMTLGNRSGLIFRAARLGDVALDQQVRLLEEHGSLSAEPYILLYGNPDEAKQREPSKEAPAVTVLPESRLAVLRTPLFAILKGSSLVRGHSHRDALSLILPPLSEDLGTPAYAHPLTQGWYRLGASHNTVCVDGDAPGAEVTAVISRMGDGIRAELGPSGWRSLRRACRTLTPRGEVLHDHAEYETEEPMTFDWIFHGTGDFSHSGTEVEAADPDGGGWAGYACFRQVRRIRAEGVFSARWALGDSVLTLRTESPSVEIFTALSPDNPADRYRHTVLLRIRGTSAVFDVDFWEESL